MRKYRAFTLIEVLVGFSLFALLMSFLTSTLVFVGRTQHRLLKEQTLLQKKRTLAHTLSVYFDNLSNAKLHIEEGQLRLETKNNVDRDPLFFDKQTLHLILDDETLVLVARSKIEPNTTPKIYPLVEGVQAIEWTKVGTSKLSSTLYTHLQPEQLTALKLHVTLVDKQTFELGFLIPPDLTAPIEITTS